MLINKAIITPTQAELYKRICDFKLDPPSAILPFSAKLAWEYQWTGIYTYRVIQEYKKFVFLAMVANHIVSPPTAIDRVWHLHLLYTHSYWDEFCDKVLKKRLHHSPSLGGKVGRFKISFLLYANVRNLPEIFWYTTVRYLA